MDWLDVEMFRDQKVVSEIVQKHIKRKCLLSCLITTSKTPSQDEIENAC